MAQLTCRVFHESKPAEGVWSSVALAGAEIDGAEFSAHGVSVSLSEDGSRYRIRANVDPCVTVDVEVVRKAEGFKIGETGTSLYGTDVDEPWGSMRHVFWPSCLVSGTITLNTAQSNAVIALDSDLGMFVMALQGMKPHHAAARWNFCNFQTESTSVVVMQYTTPVSYGSCSVGVAGVVRGGELLYTAPNVLVEHIGVSNVSKDSSALQDGPVNKLATETTNKPATELVTNPATETWNPETGWPLPESIRFDICGPGIHASAADIASNQQLYKGVLTGTLKDNLLECVDVMAELPGFIKSIVANLSGTRPYIYQFSDRKMVFKMTGPDGQEVEDEGHGYCEVTFIS